MANKVALFVILDGSGSMGPRARETVREVNEYIESLRTSPVPVEVTLTVFGGRGVEMTTP